MQIAELVSLRSTCDRANVGCVIVRNNRIVVSGYNGSPTGMEHCQDVGCLTTEVHPGCLRTVHAEAGAISFAAREGIKLQDSILYVTMSPCLECAKLIINAGIKVVIFKAQYRDLGGVLLLLKAGIQVFIGDDNYLLHKLVPKGEDKIEDKK